jgi:uncharacterized membrane protein
MSDTVPPPTSRRWNLWLIASLCVNVFLIAAIVMGLIVARNRMAYTAAGGGGGLRPDIILQLLPPSGARKMCEIMLRRLPSFRRAGTEIVEGRGAMFSAFGAEPFDAAAFRKTVERVAAAEIDAVREREATLMELVSRLTADERKHFIAQVRQRFLEIRKNPPPLRDLASACRDVGGSVDQ